MADFRTFRDAAEEICADIETYGKYTILTKFPNNLDGLKKITRRILWVLHDKCRNDKDLQKELSIIGDVVRMHPHGDQSIGTAISVMAQPFSHIVPLVYSHCNIGNYVGDSPAAARYVDIYESDIAKTLFFQDINMDMFKMVPCESEKGTEPAYLIPRIPTALLVQNLAIAIGYKTETFPMSIGDICKMTKEFIAIRSKNVDWMLKMKPLAKYTLPDFPTASVLRNSKQLLSEYRKGNFDVPIVMDGTMKVLKDKIIIYTLPPNKSFHTVTYNEGSICAKQKNSWEAQNFQEMIDYTGKDKKDESAGIMRGEFICTLRRGVNPFDVLAMLKKKLQFTSNWKPDNRFVDNDGNMTVETPFTLMSKWYDIRYTAVLGDLKQKLNDMVDQQRRLMALILVCDHTDEVYKIFKESKDEKDTIPKLTKRFNLTRYQAVYLASLKFAQITAKGREDLMAELEATKKMMNELQEKFHRVPEIMISHVEDFEKKYIHQVYKQEKLQYDLSRRCRIPKYIGAAIFRGNGHIMVESEDEFDQILKDFGDPDEFELKLFDKFGELRAIGSDEPTPHDLPKYFRSSYVDRVTDQKYTACICNKGGSLIASGLIGKLDNMSTIVPINKNFIAVYKNGMCQSETVNEKMIRKNPAAGPTMKDVVHIGSGGTDVIVIHANSSQPNLLMLERIDISKGAVKLRKIPVGTWKILGIYTPDIDRIYLNIPTEVRQRCATRHIVIDHIGEQIHPGEKLTMVFGRNTIKSNFDFSPLRKKSTIVIAKRI